MFKTNMIRKMMKEGLKPVVDKNTKILILGSFPSEESLEKGEYYAYKRNNFWKLIGYLIKKDLVSICYSKKIAELKKNGFGLWDVFASCRRKGSLDQNICDEKINNFNILKEKLPELKIVCFNGQKAGKHNKILKKLGYKVVTLPSTSPANTTLSFEEKLAIWKQYFLIFPKI